MDYTCPYCHKPTTITSPNYTGGSEPISLGPDVLSYGHRVGLTYTAIVCPNPSCRKLRLTVQMEEFDDEYPYKPTDNVLQNWPLLPESNAKPQPDYIPAPIVEDYTEACLIAKLSPKAAATLARRCMQGMIRDFHGVTPGKLYDEIDSLKSLIPTEQWEAMDALRKVGNIGAHMQKDVNVIIDIEAGEVMRLIAFIEYLFEAWYVKRHDDEEKLAAVKALAGLKPKAPEQEIEVDNADDQTAIANTETE